MWSACNLTVDGVSCEYRSPVIKNFMHTKSKIYTSNATIFIFHKSAEFIFYSTFFSPQLLFFFLLILYAGSHFSSKCSNEF